LTVSPIFVSQLLVVNVMVFLLLLRGEFMNKELGLIWSSLKRSKRQRCSSCDEFFAKERI